MTKENLFSNISALKENGFVGFKSKGELFNDCSCIPKVQGIYLVLYIEKDEPAFVEVGCGGFFKKKNPNVTISELRSNWVSNTPVIYIGKAGGQNSSATLHSRLSQYFAFGQGKAVGHYGGRYIWQLENPKKLIVCWKSLPNEEPKVVESKLIIQFISHFHQMPFANLAR